MNIKPVSEKDLAFLERPVKDIFPIYKEVTI